MFDFTNIGKTWDLSCSCYRVMVQKYNTIYPPLECMHSINFRGDILVMSTMQIITSK